jgi:hypothetical protein
MSEPSCAVCGGGVTNGVHLSRVVIQGRALDLCRAHATTVVAAMPKTFDDLCGLFAGVVLTEPRALFDRRAPLDRRELPPRPEGRRLGIGRRVADPLE